MPTHHPSYGRAFATLGHATRMARSWIGPEIYRVSLSRTGGMMARRVRNGGRGLSQTAARARGDDEAKPPGSGHGSEADHGSKPDSSKKSKEELIRSLAPLSPFLNSLYGLYGNATPKQSQEEKQQQKKQRVQQDQQQVAQTQQQQQQQQQPQQQQQQHAQSVIRDSAKQAIFKAFKNSHIDTRALTNPKEAAERAEAMRLELPEDHTQPFRLYFYSHKHNTHVTCCRPNLNPILSVSCGNIGFRKGRRRNYDSAYALTKYVIEQLTLNGWVTKINRLELVLSGFGQGREAAIKVLMGPEGQVFREKICRVADATTLKFGGTRSPKPRRV